MISVTTTTHPKDAREFVDLAGAYEYASELVEQGFDIRAIYHDGRALGWAELHALVQGWDV